MPLKPTQKNAKLIKDYSATAILPKLGENGLRPGTLYEHRKNSKNQRLIEPINDSSAASFPGSPQRTLIPAKSQHEAIGQGLKTDQSKISSISTPVRNTLGSKYVNGLPKAIPSPRVPASPWKKPQATPVLPMSKEKIPVNQVITPISRVQIDISPG